MTIDNKIISHESLYWLESSDTKSEELNEQEQSSVSDSVDSIINNKINNIKSWSSFFDQNQLKYIEKNLWNDRVKFRFHFIRHWKTYEEVEWVEKQSEWAIITDNSKEKIKEKSFSLKKIFHIDDTYLIYDEKTVRTQQTAEILRDELWISSDRFIWEEKWLVTSDKTLDLINLEKILASWKVGKYIVGLINQLNINWTQNVDIIFVIHRWTIAWIESVLLNNDEPTLIIRSNWYKELENREIDLWYEWKVLLYKNRKDLLFLNTNNYKEIIDVLRNIDWLKSVIEMFDNNRIKLLELQNYINAFFCDENNMYLFKELLSNSSNINHELHIFCLANLLKDLDKNNDVIKKFIYRIKDYNKSEKELKEIYELFNKNCKDEKLKNTIFLVLIKLWLKIDKNDLIGILTILNDSENRALDIKKNSIDNRIRNCNIEKINESLISRQLWYYEVISYWEDDYYNLVKISNIDELLSNPVNAILASVWDWKSIHLLKIKKEIDFNCEHLDYVTLFYTSRDIWSYETFVEVKSKIEKDILSLTDTIEQKIVLLFDWMDEVNYKYRQEFKEYLCKILPKKSVNVIIWSRKSEFNELWTVDYKSLVFNELSKNEIKKFLIALLHPFKRIKIFEYLDKNIIDNEIKNTPLILYLLTKVNDKELFNIDNKAMLYEKIIYNMLLEYQLNKSYKLFWLWNKSVIDTLMFCSYNCFKWEPITKELIESFWDKNWLLKDSLWLSLRKDILEQMFLLYEVSNWEYKFIHYSFQEYFTAKYFSNTLSLNEEIIDNNLISIDNSNEFINLNSVISYYCEILQNDWKIEELLNFLWTDIFLNDESWNLFFIWLEILHNLESKFQDNKNIYKMRKLYSGIIIEWSFIILSNLIHKYINFQRNVNFSDNNYLEAILKNKNLKHGAPLTRMFLNKLWIIIKKKENITWLMLLYSKVYGASYNSKISNIWKFFKPILIPYKK